MKDLDSSWITKICCQCSLTIALILQVMPIIVVFIVAFGVAFLSIMSNDEGFNNFPISILTTFIMVIGEIDYRNLFFQAENTSFLFLQRLFLIAIVVTCGIVLMNFLVGLAVDDTSKIMEPRSKAEERFQKVQFLYNVFYVLDKILAADRTCEMKQ